MKLSQIPEGGKGERHGAGRNSPGPTSLIQIPFFSRGKTPLHIPLLFAVRGRIPTLGMQTDFAQKIHARLGKFLLRFVGLMQRPAMSVPMGKPPNASPKPPPTCWVSSSAKGRFSLSSFKEIISYSMKIRRF